MRGERKQTWHQFAFIVSYHTSYQVCVQVDEAPPEVTTPSRRPLFYAADVAADLVRHAAEVTLCFPFQAVLPSLPTPLAMVQDRCSQSSHRGLRLSITAAQSEGSYGRVHVERSMPEVGTGWPAGRPATRPRRSTSKISSRMAREPKGELTMRTCKLKNTVELPQQALACAGADRSLWVGPSWAVDRHRAVGGNKCYKSIGGRTSPGQ